MYNSGITRSSRANQRYLRADGGDLGRELGGHGLEGASTDKHIVNLLGAVNSHKKCILTSSLKEIKFENLMSALCFHA